MNDDNVPVLGDHPMTDRRIDVIEAMAKSLILLSAAHDVQILAEGTLVIARELRRVRAELAALTTAAVTPPFTPEEFRAAVEHNEKRDELLRAKAQPFHIGQRVRVKEELLKAIPSSAGKVFEVKHVWPLGRNDWLVDTTYNGHPWHGSMRAEWFEAVNS